MLENTLPVTLTESLGSLPSAATGLVHLGNGRYYDPALGRPLQPNSAGGAPTVPQSLNRYAATSLGPVGVAEGAAQSGLNWLSRSAWTSVAGGYALEMSGSRLLVQSAQLTLRGSYQAIEQALNGRSLSYGLYVDTKYSLLGYGMIWAGYRVHPKVGDWLSGKLITAYEARMTSGTGWASGNAGRLADEIKDIKNSVAGGNIAGLQATRYRSAMSLKQAKFTNAAASAGLAFAVDAAFEGYYFATGTGRWGNPYWTPQQKIAQAGSVVGSDALLAFGLALSVDWPVALGAAFLWSVTSEGIFQRIPYIGEFLYGEHRNLQPLNVP